MELHDYSKYLNTEVIIKSSDKPAYLRKNVLGKHGIVARISGSTIGVLIDDIKNEASTYGVFWFNLHELKRIKNIKGDNIMTGFNHVLYGRHNNYDKVYAFALYDDEFRKVENYKSDIVVVNSCDEDNRVLVKVSSIISYQEFINNPSNKSIKITAQVVGVVDTRGYDARVEEAERLRKIEERRIELKTKLDAEIERRKTLEFYEKMAKEYSNDAILVNMVNELKELERNEQRKAD